MHFRPEVSTKRKQREFRYEGNEAFADTIAAELKEQYLAQEPTANGQTRQPIFVKFFSPTAFKSHKQNALFHSLLGIYWESGCSSYRDPEDMRGHFKAIAGLKKSQKTIRREGLNLPDTKKKKLWAAIMGLKFTDDENAVIFKALNCEVVEFESKNESWGDATKKGARLALDCLIQEMVEAGVNTQEFNEVMKQITKGEWI
jgi:hypothetical protein